MTLLLGAIADDLTGATDLALMLARSGMRTVQIMDVPNSADDIPEVDAVVVALKSRSNAPDEAVAWSLAAADALRAAGARQFYFKYCSTFDSTSDGNIGPVTDALMQSLGADFTIACPAFPKAGRSVFNGNLFADGVPLNESPLKDHPLTPMTDSNLIRVLSPQTVHEVGLVPYADVRQGAAAIRQSFDNAKAAGQAICIVDAIDDEHLHVIGEACDGMILVTGGSGLAMGLPENFRRAGLLTATAGTELFDAPEGYSAILAGSCSAATRGQLAAAKRAGVPMHQIDAFGLAEGRITAKDLSDWMLDNLGDKAPILYSTDEPEQVREIQDALGRERAGALLEGALASVALELRAHGVTRLIVAGGETSGAVVTALGITAFEIGPEIDPGVPWVRAIGGSPMFLALKSGNFGAEDFFLDAWKTFGKT